MPSLDQEISVQPRRSGVNCPALALALRASAASDDVLEEAIKDTAKSTWLLFEPRPAVRQRRAGALSHPVASAGAGQLTAGCYGTRRVEPSSAGAPICRELPETQ